MYSLLPINLLSLLCCPACRLPLLEVESGFCCSDCGKSFPLVRGVYRFVEAKNYAESFGFQWQKFATTQLAPPYSEANFRRKTGLRESDLKGKLVLDVGCGMGRFADVATRWGARVIGIDLSAAAEVAARNMAGRDFVAIQADVFAMPFRVETFDCIYSVGVLHHTPDCEKAFKRLPQYLKPGGSVAVWLYSGYSNWYRFSDQYRKITSRISIRSLYSILQVVVPTVYWTSRIISFIPLIGKPLSGLVNHLLPVSQNLTPKVRLLDTLDWYSPTYQSKHKYEQVFRWFEACGLRNLTVADVSIGVRGSKPALGKEALLPEATTDQAPSSPTTMGNSQRSKGIPVLVKALGT